jgi:hypothetical protein
LWLGDSDLQSQPTFTTESRHLCWFHRQPYCLGVMKKGSEKLVVVTVVMVSLVIIGAIVLPAFIRARTTSSQNACINNLRMIDGAKQQWALELNKAPNDMPSWSDIQPYMGRGSQGVIPKCPQGGTYILGRVGEHPRCSIGPPNHVLPP